MASSQGDIEAPIVLAVGLSVFGMGIHTVREFGLDGLWAVGTGFLPVTALQALLFLLWWRIPEASVGAVKVLLATGGFQLIGGGILSALPLPFLPFTPAQTVDHYVSHLILGLAQIPLIVVTLRRLRTPRD